MALSVRTRGSAGTSISLGDIIWYLLGTRSRGKGYASARDDGRCSGARIAPFEVFGANVDAAAGALALTLAGAGARTFALALADAGAGARAFALAGAEAFAELKS